MEKKERKKEQEKKAYIGTPAAVVVAFMIAVVVVGLLLVRLFSDKVSEVVQINPQNVADEYMSLSYEAFDVEGVMSKMAYDSEREEELREQLTVSLENTKSSIEQYKMELKFSYVEMKKLTEEEFADFLEEYETEFMLKDTSKIAGVWMVKYRITLYMKEYDYHDEQDVAVYLGSIADDFKILLERQIAA